MTGPWPGRPAVRWFPVDILPDNTVPYTAAGIDLMRSGTTFGLVEWD